MSTTAQYAATPATAMAQISTANTARDGSGTIVDVLTAGSNGTRIDDITITASGTTTAGVVRLFLYDGTNTRLWKEILVTATHNAETFNICVTRAGDF